MFKVSKLYIAITIIAWIFAFFQGGNLPYTLFYTLLCILILAIIYINVISKNLAIKIEVQNKKYTCGEKDYFTIIVNNLSILPVFSSYVKSKAIKVMEKNYKGDIVFLNINSSKWIKNYLNFSVRGTYPIGKVEITLKDLFQIVEYTISFDKEVVLKVYPKIYNIDVSNFYTGNNFNKLTANKKGIEDNSLLRDVRKYTEGDSLKKIHWKISAKYGQLFSKEFEKITGQSSNVFLNMDKGQFKVCTDEIYEEEMIDFFVSLTYGFLMRNVKSNLFLNGKQGKKITISNLYDFNTIMEFLISEKSEGEVDFINFINAHIRYVDKCSWIGIIMYDLDEKIIKGLIRLKSVGYDLTVFCLMVSKTDIEILKKYKIECLNYKKLINKELKWPI